MTLNTSSDSDGNSYQIMAQQQPNSCTIASMWMARCLATRQTVADSEWQLAVATFTHAVQGGAWDTSGGPAPQTFQESTNPSDNNRSTMQNTFGTAGITASQIVRALNAQGLSVSKTGNSETTRYSADIQTLVTARMGPEKPVICWVNWVQSGRFIGAHAIVAARKNSAGDIVYLDPMGGELNEYPNDGRYYSADGVPGYINELFYVTA